MNFKMISAAVAAAAVLAAAAPTMGNLPDAPGFAASAAEEKLVIGTLDAEISEKLLGGNHINLGNGYYILLSSKTVSVSEFDGTYERQVDVIDKLVRIGDKEIEQWRSTGKLEPTTVQCDVDVSGFEYESGNLYNVDHILLYDREHKTYFVFKLDEASGKLTKAYDFTAENDGSYMSYGAFVCGNGHCVINGAQPFGTHINAIYSPTGEKVDVNQKVVISGGYETELTGLYGSIYGATGKYICYVYAWADFGLYGVRPDGSVEKAASSCLIPDYSYDFINVSNHPMTDGEKFNKIITFDGKTYDVVDADGEVRSVNGTTAVACMTELDETTWEKIEKGYKLIDINNKGKALSKTYSYMETRDNGKTYLVQSEDGKQWGYIDSTGKEIAMFDDAGSFNGNGKYAPVVKDGKGWLVDMNMNQVSEKIDAVGCTSLGEGLFRFKTSKGDILVTSSDEGASAPADPEKPGDADGDGKISLNDVITVLKHYTGSNVLSGTQLKNADANGDGKVDLSDVIFTLKMYVGS